MHCSSAQPTQQHTRYLLRKKKSTISNNEGEQIRLCYPWLGVVCWLVGFAVHCYYNCFRTRSCHCCCGYGGWYPCTSIVLHLHHPVSLTRKSTGQNAPAENPSAGNHLGENRPAGKLSADMRYALEVPLHCRTDSVLRQWGRQSCVPQRTSLRVRRERRKSMRQRSRWLMQEVRSNAAIRGSQRVAVENFV